MSRTQAGSLPAWSKLVLALVSVLVVAALGELGFRFAFEGRIEKITGVVEWETAGWRGLHYFWDAYDPDLGWTNRPGYRSDERVPFRVTINGQGLRALGETAPRPAAGVRRIVVLGDSAAFGEEVDDDQTVPVYLEAALAGTEALNFGVRGYGLGQMALRLEKQGFAFAPDHVVVMLLLPEDIHRDGVAFFTHPKPIFFPAEEGLAIGNRPVPLRSRQAWWRRHSFLAAWLWGRPGGWPDEVGRAEAVETARLLIERIDRACRERGVGFTLVTLTMARGIERMESDPAMRREINGMRAALGQLPVDQLDLIGPLAKAYRERGAALKRPLAHWSAEGNRLIAGWIAAHLEAESASATSGPSPGG